MSTTEPLQTTTEPMTEPWDDLVATAPPALAPEAPSPIVPGGSIAGRSLTAVIAILTFLAALTAGAVTMVVGTASDWQSDVGREVTIQVRPISGRDMEADVRAAVNLTQSTTGIAEVRAYTKEESEKLVEPWLGSGLALGDLPIPRMIVVRLTPGMTPDLAALRKSLAAQVPSASLDDHRGWIDRMRAMADTAVAVGLSVLALVIVVTVLSVTFATRGAMATNSAIVEVLHYVGATDSFIAGQFQRHFLLLGLKGGAIGGGLAIALFGIIAAVNVWFSGTPGGYETAALFGTFSVSINGYIAILALIAMMAVVTALASRHTVNQTLTTID
ncbi:MAG TPA: ABC transporter permease [Xanthobacteraceae bacterium]|nr:ABC transporter permease [Xanthobacteraceae bacterium]